jgi:hypothetical protein
MTNQFNISDRAVMIKITTRAWGMGKTDKSASEELNNRKGSSDAKVNKNLVPKKYKEKLAEIKKELAGIISTQTLPATGAFEEGFRIVPIGVYNEFLESVGKVQNKMEDFKYNFCDNYYEIQQEAKRLLGDLFNYDDYPDSYVVREKFAIEMNTFPVPNEFKVPMGQEEIDRLNDQIESHHRASYNRTMNHLFGSLLEPIRHMAETLGSDKKIFESLHSNIKAIVDIIPRLNLYGNKDIEEMARKAAELIDDIPIEFYRKSEIIKSAKSKEAKSLAQEIESKMANFDF